MDYRQIKDQDMSIYYKKSEDKLIIQIKRSPATRTYLVQKDKGVYFSCNDENHIVTAIEIDNFSKRDMNKLKKSIPMMIDYGHIKRRFRL